MIPLLLLYKIAQLFLVMVLGFVLVKARVVRSEDSVVLSRISLYLLMPATIINSFHVQITPDIVQGILLAFGAAIAIHALFFATDAVFKRVGKGTTVERASVLYPNVANLIIPIVAFILGEEWVIYTCAFVAVQLCCIWTQGVHMFSGERGFHFKKILFNPNIVSIAVGVVIFVTGLRLPAFVTDITSSLGGVLGYVGMLIAGMTAAQLDVKRALKNRRLYLTTAMRVVVLPALVLVLIRCVLPFLPVANADRILLISFLASMTPAAATVMQLAQVYDTEVDHSVAINIATTLVACVTMPLFVLLYEFVI